MSSEVVALWNLSRPEAAGGLASSTEAEGRVVPVVEIAGTMLILAEVFATRSTCTCSMSVDNVTMRPSLRVDA